MKKLFIFLLLITHLNTFAFTGGVKGGINYTIPQAKNGYEEHFSNDYGYTFGGFLSFNLIDKLFLNTELMLNSWQFEFNGEDDYTGNYTDSSNYLNTEIIISLSYNFIDEFYLYLGGFTGFPTKYKRHITTENSDYYANTNFDIVVFPYGLITGISYKYNNLLFDFRYLFNMNSFLSKGEFETSCEDSENNEKRCQMNYFHQFQLLVGYEF